MGHKACYRVINYANILPKPLLRFCAIGAKEQESVIREEVVPEVIRRRKLMAQNESLGNGNIEESLPKDFLTHLAKLRHKSPEDIAKRMMAFIFASMVTSAGALTHAIYDLAGRQKEWDVLLNEQKIVIAKHGTDLTKAAMDDMPCLHAFIWESMRHAALPIQQARIVVAEDGVILRSQKHQKKEDSNSDENNTKIEELFIPKGATVMMSGYLASTDETTIDCPNEFKPDRFLERKTISSDSTDENSISQVKLTSDPASKGFFPFGIGKHHCPGRQFALAEIKGSLCVLLRSYKFQTVSGKVPKYNLIAADTLRVNEPVEFCISPI